MQSEIIYIADLAKVYGKTESSIREGLRRGVPWLPKSFKVAGQHAWLRADIASFLKSLSEPANQPIPQTQVPPKKRGRKRRIPPIVLI
ncbi:hypothetical protein FQZ97_777000 [compost metagenome]